MTGFSLDPSTPELTQKSAAASMTDTGAEQVSPIFYYPLSMDDHCKSGYFDYGHPSFRTLLLDVHDYFRTPSLTSPPCTCL
jgi:hypothetical protein